MNTQLEDTLEIKVIIFDVTNKTMLYMVYNTVGAYEH